MSFPNQKQYMVKKETSDNEHYYAKINLEALDRAMQLLGSKGSLIKLWLYFAKQRDGYEFYFSPQDCANWGGEGMSRSVIQTNLNILKDLGYIVEKDGVFTFYEVPLKYQF